MPPKSKPDEKRSRINTEISKEGHRAIRVVAAYDDLRIQQVISAGAQYLMGLDAEEREVIYAEYNIRGEVD